MVLTIPRGDSLDCDWGRWERSEVDAYQMRWRSDLFLQCRSLGCSPRQMCRVDLRLHDQAGRRFRKADVPEVCIRTDLSSFGFETSKGGIERIDKPFIGRFGEQFVRHSADVGLEDANPPRSRGTGVVRQTPGRIGGENVATVLEIHTDGVVACEIDDVRRTLGCCGESDQRVVICCGVLRRKGNNDLPVRGGRCRTARQ